MTERRAVFMEQTRERLIRYAKINTQSKPFEGTWPTTPGQADLARVLFREMESLGMQRVRFDEEACVVYGTVPASAGLEEKPSVGFIAHLDTAPDAPGENVRPWVLHAYDGGDIVLNREKDIVMRAAEYPSLRQYIGQDLVLTDGTTLLGGDDKAAIASLMTFAQYLMEHPEQPRPAVRFAFTPDEEVGGLARDLDLSFFGASFAYTIDGDHLGWYEDETFYASEARLRVSGRSVHTGTAKGIMINAADIAAQFMGALPPEEKPQYTEGTEGFFHVISCNADCESALVRVLVRDFDKDHFREREAFLQGHAEKLAARFGKDRVSLEIRHQYSNMKEILEKRPELAQRLREAVISCGLQPVCEPFRGGTDGAALSFRGLPCPNLSAGYENAHGRFEYVPVLSMARNTEILLALTGGFAR